jgi:hypothetical protein
LKPGGLLVVDLRKGTGQEADLASFAEVLTVTNAPKYRRTAAVR